MSKVVETIIAIGLVLAVCMLIIVGVVICSNPYLTYNTLFEEEINKLRASEEFVINDIVPFTWDDMYSFKPGTTKSEIEEVIGFKCSTITDVPNDNNEVSYIFVDDGKIATYIKGNVKDLGYRINIPRENDTYGVIHYYEWGVFVAENVEGIINLTDIMIYRVPDFYKV